MFHKIISFSIIPFMILSIPRISNTDKDCLTCHEDPNLKAEKGKSLFVDREKLLNSVHGEAGLSCVDCHLDLKNVENFPHLEKLKSVLCAACHEKEAKEFMTSIHGQVGEKEKTVVLCSDCHGKHDITSSQDSSSRVYATKVAEVCSRCHDDEALAQQYGFLTSRLKTYSNSFHGKASRFGETKVANCASCHGFHNIRPSYDPKSSIHPDNLPQTCGKCHPGAGKNYAKGKIHVISGKTSNKWAYFVKVFYIILIVGSISVFIIFIVADLFHHLTQKLSTK